MYIIHSCLWIGTCIYMYCMCTLQLMPFHCTDMQVHISAALTKTLLSLLFPFSPSLIPPSLSLLLSVCLQCFPDLLRESGYRLATPDLDKVNHDSVYTTYIHKFNQCYACVCIALSSSDVLGDVVQCVV